MKVVLSTNKRFNLLIVYVTKVLKNELTFEKFYINEEEYIEFLEGIKEKKVLKLSYYYQTQKMWVTDFVKTFGIEYDKLRYENDLSFLIDINNQLKDIVYQYSNGISKYVGFDSRKRLNEYVWQYTREQLTYTIRDNQIDYHGKDGAINAFENYIKNDSNYSASSGIFRMYNVGQGNMSALFLNQNESPSFIFDIGCSRKCMSAINLLSNLNNSTVIISHFHDDHINMANYFPVCGANLSFIIPEFLLPTDIYKPNIRLLLFKAIFNGNHIYQIPNDSILKPTQGFNKIITFMQGSSKHMDSEQYSDENSHGIICNIDINDKQILVPGDALYLDLFTNLNSPLEPTYVLIPHHSCEYKKSIPTRVLDLNLLKESFTFCTQHKGYHHPNKTHFQKYMVNNAKLVRLTRNMKSLIVYDGTTAINDIFYDVKNKDYYDWNL